MEVSWKLIPVVLFAATTVFSTDKALVVAPDSCGLAYDGENFWVTNESSRKLYRISHEARQNRYRINYRSFRGIFFDRHSGMLLATAEKRLLWIHPFSGKVARRIFLQQEFSGVAADRFAIYLLSAREKSLIFLDRKTESYAGKIVLPAQTPESIFVNESGFWFSDSTSGEIISFHPETGRVLKKIPTNQKQICGFVIEDNRIIVLDRDKNEIIKMKAD